MNADSPPGEGIRWWKMSLVGVYYIFCLVFPTTVSSWIADWIAEHGWVAFNRCIRTIVIISGTVCLILVIRKIWKKEGSFLGWSLIGVTGVILYLLARHLVILPHPAAGDDTAIMDRSC